jgi:four helix bundle protein
VKGNSSGKENVMSREAPKTHKDLDVWNLAMELAVEAYTLSRTFPHEERYGLALQMRRSAVSIASNVAEGAARNSRKEFIRFLYFSLGSTAELETQILLAHRLGYLLPQTSVLSRVELVRKLLLGLLRSLKRTATTHYPSPITLV